jgi:hypothetical protein
MWLLFLKYDFTIIYKLNKTHVVGDVCLNYLLSQNPQEPIIDHRCQLEWLDDANFFLSTKHME